MERELFVLLMDALRRIPAAKHRPRKGAFSDLDVLTTLLWAALHDRPISWATQRRNWPLHDRTRPLPSNATMSRRLRQPHIGALIEALIVSLRVRGPGERTLIVDGRPLRIASHSSDADARFGRVGGGLGKGYKLHEIVDLLGNCRCFRVEPMNTHESVVACQMVQRLRPGEAEEMLADSNYDTNALYEASGRCGIQLLAQRRYKFAKGVGHRRHSEHRLRSLKIMAQHPQRLAIRRRVESCFGAQGNAVGGLGPLPNFVRRLGRVRLWVGMKLAIDAAHRRRRTLASAA